jgi:hypothetical protein
MLPMLARHAVVGKLVDVSAEVMRGFFFRCGYRIPAQQLEVVRVGNRTVSGFVDDPSKLIDNLNVYVSDAE